MRNIWKIILLTIFFIFTIILIQDAFKGFEITDEGFYLLMYEKPEFYNCPSRYFIIINTLFGWMHLKIYHYRLLAIILNLLGSFIFFTGFWQYLNNKIDLNSQIWSKLSAFLFVAIGNITAFFVLFRLISYNDINNFLLLSATGFAFSYLANKEKKFLPSILLSFSGFFIAFDIMDKFPSGIIYTFFLILFLYLERKDFKCLKLLFSGILLGFIIYFTFFESPVSFITSINSTVKQSASSSQSFKVIFENYSYFIILAIKFFFKYFYAFTLVFIAALVSYKFKKYKYTYILGLFAFYLFLTAFLSSIIFAPLSSEGNIHIAMPAFLLMILFQAIFFIFTKENTVYKSQPVYLIIFLLLLPFIMAFGSGAPITLMSYLHMSPFFAVFFLLNLASERQVSYIRMVNNFLSLIVITLCISHFYFLHIEIPFRINDNIPAQKYNVNNIKKLEHIKVDKKTKIFLENLNNLMKKADFKENDYLIGYLMPGIVYIFDGISPGATYYDSNSGSTAKNIQALKNSKNILDKTYFLLPENCQLDICGYIKENEVLKNHKIIGKIENPYKTNILFVPNTPLILYKPPLN